MRAFFITLAGAIGGAALAVAIVFTLAQNGSLPINDRQMQTYLMLHPELAAAMMGRHQMLEEQKAEIEKNTALRRIGKAAYFDPKVAFVTGPVDAKNTLVEFYDYDCPYCRASLPAVKRYYEAHKNDTRFAFIEFPIRELHGPSAILAAQASLAARKQPDKYMAFHFLLLAEEGAITEAMIAADAAKAGLDLTKLKADMKDPDIARSLEASIALAHRTGVDGTPTFIMNGKLKPGMVDDNSLADEMKS
jgi:protein-disulfide isomerase